MTETPGSGACGQVLRSKGFFTLASRPWVTGPWPQAGSVVRFEPSSARDTASSYAQELAFTGTQMDAELLRADQNGCLMQEGVALLPIPSLPGTPTAPARAARMSTTPSPR
ncbi:MULTISPECIES: GTP-binding protein [unclassified Streptomyces]|uniref:GTP-binding protein n=1 Tax=unclassified Streptomyces TaxID=2593676 RepID=UPI0027B98684|nr:GTP-binding protein [Streptomyces sp. Ag82_G6-1]